jgi:hypothetical protein
VLPSSTAFTSCTSSRVRSSPPKALVA